MVYTAAGIPVFLYGCSLPKGFLTKFRTRHPVISTIFLDNITFIVIFSIEMTGQELQQYRKIAGLTQVRLANRLGVAQAYVSMMEKGKRPVPDRVARRVTRLLRLPATALPQSFGEMVDHQVDEDWVAMYLARLGYPGFRYLQRPGRDRHPLEVLLKALALRRLDPRLAEALPWLLLNFEDLDTESLVREAKSRDLQNRLGFTVSLARGVAARYSKYAHRSGELRELEEMLKPSRLAGENTYGGDELSRSMRAWVRKHRSAQARYWKLLTDMKVEHLPYARSHS